MVGMHTVSGNNPVADLWLGVCLVYAGRSDEAAAPLMKGMRDAAESYGVPIVGGHTNFSAAELCLAVSVLGKAKALITSFDARYEWFPSGGEVVAASVFYKKFTDPIEGILLIEEAGGAVTDFDGKPMTLNSLECLASNGLIHTEMQEILQQGCRPHGIFAN